MCISMQWTIVKLELYRTASVVLWLSNQLDKLQKTEARKQTLTCQINAFQHAYPPHSMGHP